MEPKLLQLGQKFQPLLGLGKLLTIPDMAVE
jgi:hypothetical protein